MSQFNFDDIAIINTDDIFPVEIRSSQKDWEKLLREVRKEYDNWYEGVYVGSVVRLKEKYEQAFSILQELIENKNENFNRLKVITTELRTTIQGLEEKLKTKQIDGDIIELLTYLSDIENYTFKEHFLLVKEESEKFKRLLQQLNKE
jgi:hypothetical protein